MASTRTLDREFGKRVRKLRQERGLTQEALAEKSALSVDAVRRVEHGAFSPTLKTIRKLALGLSVSLQTLFRSFERRRHQLLDELCDFLDTRSRQDIRLVWRVIRAVFGRSSEPIDQSG